jgi:hypothetical protein
VAVGYSLGLAASVLWLGAVGDRYGRKLLLMLGIGLSIPACLAAAFAPSIEILIVARIVGGISAGMAYPTTLALITALWAPGPPAHEVDRALVGARRSDRRPRPARVWLPARAIRVGVRLRGDPAARVVVALVMAWRFVPAHVNETSEPIDNLGGICPRCLSAPSSCRSTSRRYPTWGRWWSA